MKKRKILEVMNLSSSARYFIGDQFSYLQVNGSYEMHLICTPDKEISSFVNEQKIKYYPFVIERQVKPLHDLFTIYYIAKYIRKNKIDIVVGHQAKGMLVAMLAATIARAPIKIIMAHGVLVDTMRGWKKWLVVQEERIIANLANITLCVSNSVKRRRLEEGIDKRNKQIVVGDGTCNGIDALYQFNPVNISQESLYSLRKQYGLTNEDYVIGFCGRLVKDKGVVELIDAFEIVGQNCPNAKLLIIGPSEQRDSIPQNTREKISSNKNIIFTGFVDRQYIHQYYALMNIFVLPSYREGFPTVVLEASAMAIPIITTKSTGCVDSIIDKVTGLYVDINPDSIASAILKLEDKCYAQRLGEEGRKLVLEKYEHHIVCKNMLEFFDDIDRQF